MPKSALFWGAVMWKKWLVFTGILTLIVLLDPTHTPAQPGSRDFGRGGGFPGSGGPGYGFRRPDGGSSGYTAAPGAPAPGGMEPGGPGPGGFGFRRPDGSGPGGPGGPGMGGPGSSGMSRGSDPERSWQFMQRLTNSTGDTIDLSKIPAQSRPFLKMRAERDGTEPLPESGIWTKAQYFDFHARNEAKKAANAGNSAPGAPGAPGSPDMGGRGMRMSMGDPNGGWNGGGWQGGGWNGGGWGQGGWGQGGWDQNRPFEKKETEEEKPVAMRYGKLPKDLPSWFNELDVDQDGQVSLYEWRKSGKETKEFLKMDLNGDNLITADEYLRFARQDNINTKVEAYVASDGADRPKNWGLGAPVDVKGDGKGDTPGRGRWGGPGGGWGSSGWNRGGDKGGDKSDKGSSSERKGNPWSGKRP